MTTLSRRRLLAGGSAAALLSLTGCAGVKGFFSNLTADQLQQDLDTLISGVDAIGNALSALGVNVPADVLAKADGYITSIKSSAAALLSDIAPNQATFQALSSAVNALSILVTPFYPAASGIGAAIQAALVVVQLILQEAGILQPPPAPTLRAQKAISADHARAILNAAGASGIH